MIEGGPPMYDCIKIRFYILENFVIIVFREFLILEAFVE